METVWPDSFVEDSNLTFNIRQLRKVLGDCRESPRFIETVPRRGYRFIAPVGVSNGKLNGHNDPTDALTENGAGDARFYEAAISDHIQAALPVHPAVTRSKYRLTLYASAGVICVLVILGTIYFWDRGLPFFTRGPQDLASQFDNLSVEKLTDTGNVAASNISPDGRMLVYITDEAGKHVIWMRQLATGKSVPITEPTEESIHGVSFSKDGQYLYYVSQPPQGATHLSRISILGGLPVRILSGAHGGYGLSPDGASIAYIRFGPQGSRLMIADSNGSNERAILSSPPPRIILSLSWSQDGKAIAYSLGSMVGPDNDFEIFEFDLESGNTRPLSDYKWNYLESIAFLPDRSGLIVSGRASAETTEQVFVVPTTGGKPRQLTFDSSTLNLKGASSDFTKFIASLTELDSEIWVSPAGELSDPVRVSDAQFDVLMTPDGRIVYPARDTAATDIWIMNRDGTGRKQLTEDSSAERWPAVSADGKYIAFVSNNLGKQNIWRINLDGSDRTKLTDGDGETYPEFTPDGRFVLFNSLADGNLWQVPVEGGSPTKILGEKALRISVAPDGKKFAHFGGKDGKRKLLIRSYPGGEIIKEFDSILRQASFPRLSWTKDGSSLIFDTYGPTYIGNLFRQPLDGSEPVPITNFTSMQIFDYYILPSCETAFVRGSWKHDAVLLSKQN